MIFIAYFRNRFSVMPAKQVIGITRVIGPFQRFFNTESAGGILLLITTVTAMVWANSNLSESYFRLINRELTLQVGEVFKLSKPLLLWINDGLMAIFFFVVGLEIKREVIVGELSSFRQAALPIFAAAGGMLIPALIFLALHGEDPGAGGWGIPMATDIAFSLGILSLLGKRVPLALKVFLVAFAIVDDLGAVIVIAVFYSQSIGWNYLLIALLLFVLLAVSLMAGMRSGTVFMVVGGFIWYYVLKSGLHPTIAGVMLALIVPVKRRIKLGVFTRVMKLNLRSFGDSESEDSLLLGREQLDALDNIETYVKRVHSPLQYLEHTLHKFTSFFVMPLFALVNAGIILQSRISTQEIGNLTLDVLLALVLGKFLGILVFSWLGVKLKWMELPEGIRWVHMVGLGFLGGIGFTMSMFIATLAYPDPELLNAAKVGILIGSALAGICGYLILKLTLKPASGET